MLSQVTIDNGGGIASSEQRRRSLEGVLLGTAVGDALGLPREGLSRRRARRFFGGPPLRHRLLFGRGMVSDDTEHTCMVAQSLLASGGDARRFGRSLAWRLRGWLLAMPAGIGLATLRAILKLWLGFPPVRNRWMPGSGVRSAGNGPAMRAAIIGVWANTRLDAILPLIQVSTEITHTDVRARSGATAIAIAAAYGAQRQGRPVEAREVLQLLRESIAEPELAQAMLTVAQHLERGSEPAELAAALGQSNGVGGYINHTTPIALYCWLRYPTDFRAAVESAILLGGDTDTVGAIVGALCGATLGADSIPAEWLNRIVDWPRSVGWMRRLAGRLALPKARPLPLFWPAIPLRNLSFMIVVLLHGLRRLLPPY